MDTKLIHEKTDWDYIIVGTGIGGATLGYRLAKAGKKVLFCEQGRSDLLLSESLTGNYAENFFPTPQIPGPQHKEILAKAGRWCSKISDTSDLKKIRSHIPFIGAGTGGSSALYGGAMERFWQEDFEPGKWHKEATGSSLPGEWPVTYKELEPYYEQAEQLYRLRGGTDPFKKSRIAQNLMPPPQLSPANHELFKFLQDKGLHPYRLPTACEFIPECQSCQGFICARGCKNDSVKTCLKPAIELHGAQLLDRCEIKKIDSNSSRVVSMTAIWGGDKIKLRGKNFILAAGAIATPVILLQSTGKKTLNGLANESGMVGRNLMRHFVDMYILFSGLKPGIGDNSKEIAFNDFYTRNEEKFGTVQSFGLMPSASIIAESLQQDMKENMLPLITATLFKAIKPFVRSALDKALCNRLVMASTLEDLPYPENRVMPSSPNSIQFSYKINEYDRHRIQKFRKALKHTFHPWRYALIKQAENNERLAHVCGTCRMGDDPKNSVVDKFNRVHSLDNLFIVDSSFFPSSGGTNPSLTIAANALRISEHILQAY